MVRSLSTTTLPRARGRRRFPRAARGAGVAKRALGSFLALLTFVLFVGIAHADPLDDTLAKFLDNKFPQTEKAVAELAAAAPPQAAAILDALGDNRLLIDPAARLVVYKTKAGALMSARSGVAMADVDADSLKKVRVNNAIRSAIDAAVGALTIASPDAGKRVEAAEAVYKSRDAKALPAVKAQLARETNSRAAAALRQAEAAIVASDAAAAAQDRVAAIAVLKERGDEDAQGLIDEVSATANDPSIKAAAAAALGSIHTRLLIWGMAQNLWYGLSASSVLLLAAIGLAITFGVMGVINMAHGEMVMLGAYATFVVQRLLPAGYEEWSLAVAIPVAFAASALVGIAIERLIIRYLYTRPLETLLATWGVSLVLQQLVRDIFGANNRQVLTPAFMSGGFQIGGLSITTNRLLIIVLAIVVFLALQLVLRATPFGLRMRAVTQNRRMAAAMGISTQRVDMFAFGLGSGIAGVAGVAISQIDNVSPNLGQGYIIDSFMVVVLGGVGNLWGTLLGALTLGVANKLLEPTIGAVLGKIVLLVFIILFIQKRPRGLFALKGRAVEA
jgi:urea transport system permease protein